MNHSTLETYSEERPWGSFTRFTNGEPSTVKIISVKPDQSLSLQYHEKREEFWRILSGEGSVTIGTETKPAHKGDEFFIKKGEHHRISAGAEGLEVLEISFGEFDENDITRLEDNYGRK